MPRIEIKSSDLGLFSANSKRWHICWLLNGRRTTKPLERTAMIITTKQFLSSVWLVVALLVATLLIAVLPNTVQAQALSSNEVSETGHASWHNLSKHGAKTVSGERYDHKAMSAAHATLPFDTMVHIRTSTTFTTRRTNSFSND